MDRALLVFNAACFEGRLSGAGVKSGGCPMWGSNPFLLSEQLQVSTQGWRRRGWWGLRRDCDPASLTCFDVDRRSGSASFYVFSEDVVPYVAIDLLCLWEEVSSGSCKVAILNRKLVNLLIEAGCLPET